MSLFGSLELGKKSLSAAQTGQSTTGHNMANVDTKGFSRQQVTQAASLPMSDGKGTGVDVTGVRRMQDGFIKEKVVAEQTKVGSWATRENVLTEAELIYTDLEGNRLRGAMDEFWNAWGSVSNEPESVPMRKALLEKSVSLTRSFNLFSKRLSDLRTSLNEKISRELDEVNQITREIAQLNKQVQQIESRGRAANDVRDRRDVLLQELSEKMNIKSFELENGAVEVQMTNGLHLVHGRDNYKLTPIISAEGNGDVQISLINPPGIETDITHQIKGGILNELVFQRDGNLQEFQDNLNEMVTRIASNVNKVHAAGTGINGIKFSEKTAYSFDKKELELPVPNIKDGKLEFKILSKEGDIDETISVNIEAGKDTLNDVIEKINRSAGAYEKDPSGKETLKEKNKFLATIEPDGRISLKTGEGKKFIFGQDQSGILGEIGFNSFFHFERGAADIHVNQELVEDEMKIVSGMDMLPGDNRVALKMVDLQNQFLMNDGTITFNEFYNRQITDIGVKVQDAQKGNLNHQQMLDQYEALRNSVSSVNIDEEMANMVKYQRAYESSAKFLSTVDQMTQTLVNM